MAAPVPDLSKIAGESNAPPDMTASLEAFAMLISEVPSGQEMASSIYLTPTACSFLRKLRSAIRELGQTLLDYDPFNTLASEYLQF